MREIGADTPAFDRSVRLKIYGLFVAMTDAPGVEAVAAALDSPVDDVAAAFRRLADGHVIVLSPGTLDLRMANPMSAVPTPFRVEAEGRSFWGNCVWDALGILAMLDADGLVGTTCPDCDEPMQLEVRGGQLASAEGIAHYAVPAAQWWDDIVFT
jgi:Alkylmercury lyase